MWWLFTTDYQMQNKSRAWQYREWYLHIWSFLSTFVITPFLSWSTRYAPNERLFSLLVTAQLPVSRNASLFGLPVRGESRKVLFLFLLRCIKAEEIEVFTTKALFFSKRQKLLDRSRASTCCQVWRIILVEHHVITKSVEPIGQISSHIYNCLYIAPITVVNRVLW